ncbi:S-layer homology domain-containing protein [Paenibacillus doosanensis]|uniref:S-layer homology domain-containing protein n=1 Tax=Paenibacillus doosanensis TaxID=1229154 RepID=UPI00217FDBE1|nr:S-layer homology domain-containing protein [Paenibacillus doosanensis]MCS7460264.1 S-layer homology domain-containing protein [Paenibacillus doosanensis]
MKPAVFKKTAQVTVLMLIISALLPVLAFAATGFKNLTYRDGTVSGSVYSDVYSENAQVYLYDPNGNYLGTASTATYSVYDGVYTYNFSSSVSNSYTYLNLLEKVTDSVYGTVYNSTSSSSGGHKGGGGGGSYIPSGPSITVSSDGYIDANTLINALTNNDVIELVLSGDTVLIPAKALKDFVGDKNKALVISNGNGTYTLPLYVLNLDGLADKLSASVDDMTIKVSISAAGDSVASDIQAAAEALGGTVASGSVDFDLVAYGTDSTTTTPVELGNNYISRTLPLTKAVDPSKATAVVFDPASKKLSFAPALFSSEDDSNEATIKRNGNSIYTVIELNKSFADSQGHWAQSYIDLLANKLVIDGVTDTSFEPERNITRAEFAALVVRALGLDQLAGGSSFTDVSSGDWFSSVVATAVNAKIIDGYEDHTFRPNQPITREELSAMVVRALAYAGAKPDVSADRQAELLAKFSDSNQIVWAQQELAAAIEAGIVDGMTDTTIAPSKQATRAQSAAMLKRLLTKADFINN